MFRVLLANESAVAPNPPNDPPPAEWSAAPEEISGWSAWWPSPPATSERIYRVPDPPGIDRPILPWASAPVLWEAAGEPGGVWNIRVSGIFARSDWMDRTGNEAIKAGQEIETTLAVIKIRQAVVVDAGIEAKGWMVETDDDLRAGRWEIQSVQTSYRAGDFSEMNLRRVR